MALSCRHMLRAQTYRKRSLTIFAKACSNSADKTGKDKDLKQDDPTAVETKAKTKEASKKLSDLLSQLKVVGIMQDKKIDLNNKLARPPDHKLMKENNTLLKIQKEEQERFSDIEPPLVDAIQSVASSIGGNTTKTESELIRALTAYKQEAKTSKKSSDLGSLFSGMIIEKTKRPTKTETSLLPQSKSQTFDMLKNREHRELTEQRKREVKLFGGPRLGVFTKTEEPKKEETSTMWDICADQELRRLRSAVPSNAFEEMIRWTEQGKLWKFPIDNEQGLEEERDVPFHEHVFLERHLQEGFPLTGPVRHFMELVCVGLSKNPYISKNRKLEHIQWFRDYFKRKQAMLEEIEVVKQEASVE